MFTRFSIEPENGENPNRLQKVWEILKSLPPTEIIDRPVSTVSDSWYWVVGTDKKGLLAVTLNPTDINNLFEVVTIPREASIVFETPGRIIGRYKETIGKIRQKYKLGEFAESGIAAV